jgi:hypothetical protein
MIVPSPAVTAVTTVTKKRGIPSSSCANTGHKFRMTLRNSTGGHSRKTVTAVTVVT